MQHAAGAGFVSGFERLTRVGLPNTVFVDLISGGNTLNGIELVRQDDDYETL